MQGGFGRVLSGLRDGGHMRARQLGESVSLGAAAWGVDQAGPVRVRSRYHCGPCNGGDLRAHRGLAVLEGRWQPGHPHAAYLEQRFYRPRARIALGCQLRDYATAAIDISDGLLADVGHLAAASGVGVRLEPGRVPLSAALLSHDSKDTALRWALAGGDDYELCFCLPRGHEPPEGATCIGEVVAGEGVDCGDDIDIVPGYQHFSESAPR